MLVRVAGPLGEIEFWQSRTLDLSGIRSQLDRAGVRKIVAVLRKAQSTYLEPFDNLSRMIQNVGGPTAEQKRVQKRARSRLINPFTLLCADKVATLVAGPQL